MKKLFLALALGISLFSWSCTPSVYFVKPSDWDTAVKQDSTINYYSQYLKDWKIFVDPGHGGEDRRSHGPTGETEADINLRVGLSLRDYLTRAGATVFISRTKDTTVSLLDRPKLAAESGADIFISIHHNATGSSYKYPPLNFTSTWYHAFRGDSAYSPTNHDLAKYVERDLAYAMGNPEPNFFSFDGTLSDYLIYPFSGFAVLRYSKIPAILTECSFFTSPYEERRLKLDTFNEIEAWGIFKGLGKYFQAGIPELSYAGDTLFSQLPITFEVSYSQGKLAGGKYAIDKNYLDVSLDGKPVAAEFKNESNPKVDDSRRVGLRPRRGSTTPYGIVDRLVESSTTRRDPNLRRDKIAFTLNSLLPGRHYFSVIIKNENGNHSFPFLRYFDYVPPAAEITASVFPDTLSAKSSEFFTRTEVSSVGGYNISDFVNLSIVPTNAVVETTFHSNEAIYTIFRKNSSKKVVIKYLIDTLETVLTPSISDSVSTASISVASHKGIPLEGAVICSDGKTIASTLSNGFAAFKYDGEPLQISRQGYYIKKLETLPKDTVRLTPIADGALIGKIFLIDPAFGGNENGPTSGSLRAADVDLATAKKLNDLLQAFGANSQLVRSADTTLTVERRATFSKRFSRGFYLVISASNEDAKFSSTVYPSIENHKLAEDLLRAFSVEFDTSGVTGSDDGIFKLAALGTAAIEIPSPKTDFYSDKDLEQQSNEVAWRILDGILSYFGYIKAINKTDYVKLDNVIKLPLDECSALSIDPSRLNMINKIFLNDYREACEEK